MDATGAIKIGATTLAWLALLAGSLQGQAPDPRTSPDDKTASLEGLRFMAGCWRGTFETKEGPATIEERYSGPEGGLVLGTTRYLVGGVATQFEFTSIRHEGDEVVLTPHPGGIRSEHGFRLTAGGGERAVFEAPEHDYPKRILYRREAGLLVARIDGGADDRDGQEWRMSPAACTGEAP